MAKVVKIADQKVEEPTVTLNGKSYLVSELSAEAQTQFMNVKIAENELNRLQVQLAITETAKRAYEQALVSLLD
jgi:hypothetical protein